MLSADSASGYFPAHGRARCRDLTRLSSASLLVPRFPTSRSFAMFRFVALACLLSLVFGAVPAAEVYKWKDADGHVHFGDHPPDTEAESVTIRSGPPAADNTNRQEHLRQVLDGYTREREAREASRASEKMEAERRERICIRARARQHSVENANFLYDYTARGERRVLEGAEYKRAIENARQAVADSCD